MSLGYRVARRLVIQVQERDGPLWASLGPMAPLMVGQVSQKPPADGPTAPGLLHWPSEPAAGLNDPRREQS